MSWEVHFAYYSIFQTEQVKKRVIFCLFWLFVRQVLQAKSHGKMSGKWNWIYKMCWRTANERNLWTQLACWRRHILTSKELSLKADRVCKTYLWDWGRQRRSELILWSARDWGLVEPVRQLLSEPVCGVIKQLTLQHVRSAFTCVCEEQREVCEYKINPVKVLISHDLLSHVAACL